MLLAQLSRYRGGAQAHPQFERSHPVSLSGEDSCFVVLARRRFADWTNISADISPVGKPPFWPTTHEKIGVWGVCIKREGNQYIYP